MRLKRTSRNRAMWVLAAAAVIVAGAVVWMAMGIRSSVRDAVGSLSGPQAPKPTAVEMEKRLPTPEGHSLTVKQRDSGWLPGGKLSLHLDDITNGQVLVSVTDADDQVVFGPRSLRPGEKFTVSAESPVLEIEVAKLVNVLTGDDFGEFVVRSVPGH